MSVERSEKPEDWVPIFERIVWQVSYRQLGIVALYCPIDVSAKAIDILCRRGYGNWKWLLENRVLVWENVPVNNALKIHMYVFGSSIRRRNTVLVRQGFWRCYVIEVGLRLFDESLVGRIIAKI
jgi:hypothetical protein